VSWRMAESKREVYMLKDALAQQGVEVLIVGELPGAQLAQKVYHGIAESSLVIIFATATYGTSTSGVIDTQKELLAIFDQKKEYFLIKMCDEMRDPVARGLLPFSSTSYIEWLPGTAMPDKLAQKICKKLGHSTAAPVEAAASIPPVPYTEDMFMQQFKASHKAEDYNGMEEAISTGKRLGIPAEFLDVHRLMLFGLLLKAAAAAKDHKAMEEAIDKGKRLGIPAETLDQHRQIGFDVGEGSGRSKVLQGH